MIVLSAALVFLAIILLIVGFASNTLGLIFACIALCLLALGLIMVGVLQRREDTVVPVGAQPVPRPDAAPVPVPAGRSPLAPANPDPSPRPAPPPAPAPVDDRYAGAPASPDDDSGMAWVIDGRPHYHRQGCAQLADGEPVPVDLSDAVDDGFLPCPVCRAEPSPPTAAGTDAEVDAGGPGPVPPTSGGSSRAPLVERPAAPRRAPVAEPVAAVPTEPPAAVPTEPPAAVPTEPPAAVPTEPPAAVPVLILPGRGRYHRPTCRYVAGAPEAVPMPKDEAIRSGYESCPVCTS